MITHETSLINFHSQLGFVRKSWTPHGLKAAQFSNVVIGGLGGSGIGGRIAKLAFFDSFPIPVEVIADYHLPAYAGKNTLLILSSYSGNTEETLSVFQEGIDKGCTLLAISSGGFLKKKCEAGNIRCYEVETGYQPRMALGYSLSFLLMILGELAGQQMDSRLEQAERVLKDNDWMKKQADEMFAFFQNSIHKKFVVICDMAFEGAAVRFCQQLQENAKSEAFVSVLPEANHNMIESYYGQQDTNFVLLYSGLNEKVGQRFSYIKNLLNQISAKYYEMPVNPFSLTRLFEVIHITDWFSILLSDAREVNNLEVPNIARLKLFLDEKQG